MMGLLFMNMMNVAKERGVTLRCVVPTYAASMAYHIFGACDERYALPKSQLLWHQMTASGKMNADQADYIAREMRRQERRLDRALIFAMKCNPRWYVYHRNNETMWSAEDLHDALPKFFQIVDDVQGLPEGVNLYSF